MFYFILFFNFGSLIKLLKTTSSSLEMKIFWSALHGTFMSCKCALHTAHTSKNEKMTLHFRHQNCSVALAPYINHHIHHHICAYSAHYSLLMCTHSTDSFLISWLNQSLKSTLATVMMSVEERLQYADLLRKQLIKQLSTTLQCI